MNEYDIIELLNKRYQPPEWVFLPHVRNGTGYSRKTTRTADALAISTYPSRGIELHGFEIKVSRTDWLKELKSPDKAESIARFCDRWWLVISEKEIIQDGEIPTNWGILVCDKGKLKIDTQAKTLSSQPIDKLMLASIFRTYSDVMIPKIQIKNEITKAEKRGEEKISIPLEYKMAKLQKEMDDLRAFIKQFENNSGIRLHEFHYKNPEKMGKLFQNFLEITENANPSRRLKENLLVAKSQLKRMLDNLESIENDAKNLDIFSCD